MAIKTEYIDTMPDLFRFISDHPFNQRQSRHRDLYLYRGLPDANFALLTSLARICKGKRSRLEPNILENFSKYAELEDATIKDSIWRKMILGQHHGLPTRLLDWSKSPLVALHFAMTEGDMDNLDKRDCVVWRIDATKFYEKLPMKYQSVAANAGQKIFTVDMIDEVCGNLSQYDNDMGQKNMVILEPPSMDERMMNQYSFFSVIPNDVDKVEEIFAHHEDAVIRYQISKNLRWEIRDFLDMSNINERIIYPGLDGIANWLSRHYFVRNASRLHILKENLVTMDVDIIVNAASKDLINGGSVCYNIFQKAGEKEMTKACRKIGTCEVGDIVATNGFNLKAGTVIHAVGPNYRENLKDRQDEKLRSVYEKSLQYLIDHDKHSIAFPLLSTGNCHYPKEIAFAIALETCVAFMSKNDGYPLDISFCVLTEMDYILGKQIYNKVMNIAEEPEEMIVEKYNRKQRRRNINKDNGE